MKSLLTPFLVASASGLMLFFSGCASSASYIDPKGTETIVSLNQIDTQDWNTAAEEMINSLFSSGVLERSPKLPAVMAVSKIRNDTMTHIDTDLLVKKMRVSLSQSGKVVTTTTLGYGNNVEDPVASEAAQMQAMLNNQKQSVTLPDYTLSGKIIESQAQAGRTKQVTYTFQLSLTTVRDGLAVWEDERQISKQGKRAAVGW